MTWPTLLRGASQPQAATASTSRLPLAFVLRPMRWASSVSDGGDDDGRASKPAARRNPSRLLRSGRKDPFADPNFTLEHFLLRDKCVKLWRDFLRASRNIPNPEARRETIDWLRYEHFEGPSGLRNISNVSRIREGLVAGSVTLKRVCGPMELASALLPQHGSFPKIRGRRAI